MRFITVILATLLGSAFAAPATPATPNDEGCCCCDISAEVIRCTDKIEASNCICAAVVCPPTAPTIWDVGPIPYPTPTYDPRTRSESVART